MRSRARALAAIAAIVLCAAACAPVHADADSSAITDVELHFSDGGAYLVFVDRAGDANKTSGRVTFYRRTARFRDAPKMAGRGVNQQIVMERVPSETFEPIITRDFYASDFRDLATSAARSRPVLPVVLPVKDGDMVRVEFGLVRRDVEVGR